MNHSLAVRHNIYIVPIYLCVCVCVCLFCYTCEDQLLRRHLFCEDISCCEDILGGPFWVLKWPPEYQYIMLCKFQQKSS